MCSAHDDMIRSQIALTIAKTIQLCQHDYPLQFRVPLASLPVLSLLDVLMMRPLHEYTGVPGSLCAVLHSDHPARRARSTGAAVL